MQVTKLFLAVVSQFCNRILVMKQGQIIEEGTVRQIVNSPKKAYTRQLLNSMLAVDPYENDRIRHLRKNKY